MRVLGALLGVFLIVAGLYQLWWAKYLLGNSDHMGSPIWLHGKRFVESLPPENREHAQGFLDLGGRGFHLLESSLQIFLETGASLLLVGVVVTTIACVRGSSSPRANGA
jgi:hypothetical protein